MAVVLLETNTVITLQSHYPPLSLPSKVRLGIPLKRESSRLRNQLHLNKKKQTKTLSFFEILLHRPGWQQAMCLLLNLEILQYYNI